MKNSINCPNCKTENPFYRTTCLNCKSYLRDRVYNLDLWKSIGLLIENPLQAFKLIIFSEQKNFILFILIIAAVKYLVNARFAAMITLGEFQSSVGLLKSYILILVSLAGLIILSAFLFTFIGKKLSVQMRFKDNLAVLCYTQSLYVIALVILFPIELIVFGDYLFSVNPSPFVLKELIAYILLGIEILFLLWSYLTSYFAFYTQIKLRLPAILAAIIFNTLLILLIIFGSKIIFTI